MTAEQFKQEMKAAIRRQLESSIGRLSEAEAYQAAMDALSECECDCENALDEVNRRERR